MIKLSGSLFIAATLSAALVFAQGPRPQASGGSGTPHDPSSMIQTRVNRLATLLGLTDAQKTQATTIFTNAFTASQSILTSLEAAHQSLSAAVTANSTSTIDQVSGTIGTLEGQLLAINSKADATFYAILTSDQQTKFEAMSQGGPSGGFGPPGPGFGPAFRGGPPPQ